MKLLLPDHVTSVSVDGREYLGGANGIIDVGNLDSQAVEKLLLHAGCTLAVADDAITAETKREENERRTVIVARLKELKMKVDNRLSLPALEDVLFNAEATEIQRQKDASKLEAA